MGSQTPKHIVCAVRATRQSRETVTKAIDLALEHGAYLTFFYVVDAEFHAQTAIGSPLSVIYNELVNMSEFLMLILCDRAQRRGVSKVDYVIREGNVRKQLRQLAIETHADMLVMGRPTRGPGRPTFKPAEFEAFVTGLEEEGNLRVVLVESA
jgi:nucleotide-binding universal stress UspA family protein